MSDLGTKELEGVSLRPSSEAFEICRAFGGTPLDVQALWYRIYVGELRHDMPRADHRRELLDDPMAEEGRLYVARSKKGGVLGTVLSLYSREADLGLYYKVFDIPRECAATSLTTKLTIHPSARRSRLAFRLAEATFLEGYEDGIAFSYADCQASNLQFFEALGYRRMEGDYSHPVFGQSVRVQANFGPCDPLRLSASSLLGRSLARQARRARTNRNP